MSKPNKTVQAARRRMGGFPERPSKPNEPWFDWMWDQMKSGRMFSTTDEAKRAFEAEQRGEVAP